MTLGYPAPQPCSLSAGGGLFQPEWVAGFNRKRWPFSAGIGGLFEPEWVAFFGRNTHKWIDFDGFMIPEEYRTTDLSVAEDDPEVQLKVEKTVRMVTTDFAPEFDANDFTLPEGIKVLENGGFGVAR